MVLETAVDAVQRAGPGFDSVGGALLNLPGRAWRAAVAAAAVRFPCRALRFADTQEENSVIPFGDETRDHGGGTRR